MGPLEYGTGVEGVDRDVVVPNLAVGRDNLDTMVFFGLLCHDKSVTGLYALPCAVKAPDYSSLGSSRKILDPLSSACRRPGSLC